MKAKVNRAQENENLSAAEVRQKREGSGCFSKFVDNRPETAQLQLLQKMADNAPQTAYVGMLQRMVDHHPQASAPNQNVLGVSGAAGVVQRTLIWNPELLGIDFDHISQYHSQDYAGAEKKGRWFRGLLSDRRFIEECVKYVFDLNKHYLTPDHYLTKQRTGKNKNLWHAFSTTIGYDRDNKETKVLTISVAANEPTGGCYVDTAFPSEAT